MEPTEEYHDPDYAASSEPIKKEVPALSEDEKIEKIKSIIRREFSNELGTRENEVMLIEQRMSTSRRMLHRLRYAIVNSYYNEQKLQLSHSQVEDDVAAQHEPRARAEVSSLLREGQRRLHPSVRKLLGRQTADLAEIFKTRAPRNKSRRDYSAMVQSRNYTIATDGTKSLRPERKDELEAEPEAEPAEASTSRPRKVPRHLEPKAEKVVTIDEATRNKMKHRYRLIVGNTSKYAPPASRLDRSTHKWLLYVRGPPSKPDPSAVLTHVVARLHHSYAPHHTVHVYKPPFHISRRGWGEFPARVELHFPLPAVNRPAAIDHPIKLDRNYTTLQTLGAETIVEVWLYSTPEMLPFEYTDPVPEPLGPPDPAPEAPEAPAAPAPVAPDAHEQSESWMEFFSKDSTELDVDEMIIKPVKKEIVEEKSDMECDTENSIEQETRIEEWPIKIEEPDMYETSQYETNTYDTPFETADTEIPTPASTKKRIMKYIDSTTGKIYYLEMDRNLDLTKVQEIVINNTKAKISPIKSNGLKSFRKKKGGVSLLKPEVKNQLKSDSKDRQVDRTSFTHIENDHCYLGNGWQDECPTENSVCEVKVKTEKSHYKVLCEALCRLTCVRTAVNYLLKKIPIITEKARDPDYVVDFPFVVENEDKFWKLDFAKRRNIEWSRAKLITRLVSSHLGQTWRTKQVLAHARLHAFHVARASPPIVSTTGDWSSWGDLDNGGKLESNIKEVYPDPTDITSLTLFKAEDYLNTTLDDPADTDEEVDIISTDSKPKLKVEVAVEPQEMSILPVESEEERLRFLFVERVCADIGVELRNEDVGNGYSYSAVHAVLLSAVKCYAEELIRGALAQQALRETGTGGLPPIWTSSRPRAVRGAELYAAARAGRGALAAAALATRPHDHTTPL